jgi:hypothetical protein
MQQRGAPLAGAVSAMSTKFKVGAQVATFPRSHIPAFSAQTGFFDSNGTLAAIDQTSQNTLWTFTGAGGLTSIAIDPTGDHRLLLRDCVCPQCDSWQRAVEGLCRRPDQWSRSTNVTQAIDWPRCGRGILGGACWHCAQRQASDSVSATGCSPVAAALRGQFE